MADHDCFPRLDLERERIVIVRHLECADWIIQVMNKLWREHNEGPPPWLT